MQGRFSLRNDGGNQSFFGEKDMNVQIQVLRIELGVIVVIFVKQE